MQGCLTCQSTKRCVIHDDADAIARKMLTADVIVFATPIYYYGMCGQMKTMLDRANPLFSADYAFREIYLLATAAEEGQHTVTERSPGCRDGLTALKRPVWRGRFLQAA